MEQKVHCYLLSQFRLIVIWPFTSAAPIFRAVGANLNNANGRSHINNQMNHPVPLTKLDAGVIMGCS